MFGLVRVRLAETRFHAHLRDFLNLRLAQPQSQRRRSHEKRVLSQQRVAEWEDVIRLLGHPNAH